MQTLADLIPDIGRFGNREAVRWSNGFRTWVATYAELYGRIGAAVAYFDARQIRKGDVLSHEEFWAEIDAARQGAKRRRTRENGRANR